MLKYGLEYDHSFSHHDCQCYWLRTGDKGSLDDEGFLTITGRIKDLFKTSGGKYIAPSAIEAKFKALCPYASQFMVFGNDRNFVVALITLDPDALSAWAQGHGKSGKTTDLVDDPDLHAEIEAAVEDANKAVSKAESIRKFKILADAWTEEGGQLTPSLKLKRNVVMRESKDEIVGLYYS